MRGLVLFVILPLAAVGCRPVSPPWVGGGSSWLEIEILGLESPEGQVAVALFASHESFRAGDDPLRRAFLPIEERRSVWRAERLAPGEYAVKAYHDLDGDGALGVNIVGAPTEPYGFSNGSRGSFGPPSWRQARFGLGPDGARISITVR